MQNCSKCNGTVAPFAPTAGISMYLCRSCKGTWFPKGMLEAYLNTSQRIEITSQATNSGLRCSSCNQGTLMTTSVAESNSLKIDICNSCEGIFLDANEIREIKSLAKSFAKNRPASAQRPAAAVQPTGPFKSAKIPLTARKPAHSGLFAVENPNFQDDRIQAINPGLLAYNHFFVKQRKEWSEIVINLETKNKYDIMDPNGLVVGHAAEHSLGAGGFFARLFLGAHRPFTATIWDHTGNPQIEIRRPFFFLFSDMFVSTTIGASIGSIHRRFHILHSVYDIKDSRGRLFARIKRPLWRLWKFSILDGLGNETGVINKRWAGILKEMFTSADTYEVNLGEMKLTDLQRAVLMAATIAIDFDHFETQSKNGRGLSLDF